MSGGEENDIKCFGGGNEPDSEDNDIILLRPDNKDTIKSVFGKEAKFKALKLLDKAKKIQKQRETTSKALDFSFDHNDTKDFQDSPKLSTGRSKLSLKKTTSKTSLSLKNSKSKPESKKLSSSSISHDDVLLLAVTNKNDGPPIVLEDSPSDDFLAVREQTDLECDKKCAKQKSVSDINDCKKCKVCRKDVQFSNYENHLSDCLQNTFGKGRG